MARAILALTRRWPLAASWRAAAELAAATFGVDAALITAPSRGRGPRPPEAAREPKKLALYLAVTLSDADYAAVARYVGLHKDTVTSHCADIRERAAIDERLEDQLDLLERAAIVRLEMTSAMDLIASPGMVAGQTALENSRAPREALARLRALKAHLDDCFAEAFARSDEAGGSSDAQGASSDNRQVSRVIPLKRAIG